MQNNTVEFMKEYEMMQAIDHNNIVRLYGVILDAAQIMLITELAPLRSLLECLRETSLRTTFTVPCLSRFSHQICEGMAYLESKRLIHRDLAARNVLVARGKIAKVADFGLARDGEQTDYYRRVTDGKLPVLWMSPESLFEGVSSTKSDV